MPTSGGRHHSHSSYYESISPPPPIQEQEEQRSSSATPNSGSGGKITPTIPTAAASGGSTSANQSLKAGPTSKTGLAGSDVETPQLPPLNSPEGSYVEPVQSGPYLDPPTEFSSRTTPTNLQSTSPTATKPHPPVNGGIRYQQQIDVSATAAAPSDQQVRETSPFDHEQPLLQANSNGNNSNSNLRVVPLLSGDCSANAGAVNGRVMSNKSSRGLQRTDVNFPSLTHSDNAETCSSVESGFDADNELETATAWYLSSDTSPRLDTKVPRPKLGPQVAIGSTANSQNRSPPARPPHGSSASASGHVTHYQQYSGGVASDMQSLGGSQKSRESSISEYDRLHHDRTRQQAVMPLHGDRHFDDQRRGSVPDNVGLSEDGGPVYSEVYPACPSHKASMSFDSAEILGGRLQSTGRPPEVVRFTSPPPRSTGAKVIRHHHVVFNGHSPTPGAPLSPVTVDTATTASSYQHSIRSASGIANTTMTSYRNGVEAEVRNHSRSRSQPEDMVNAVGVPSPLVPHSHSQPYYTNDQQLPALPEQTSHHQLHYHHRHHHHYHHHGRDRTSGHHRRAAERSIFKSSYSANSKAGSKSHGKSHRGGDGCSNGRGQGSQLPHATVNGNQQYSNNKGSQESAASGRGTPLVATPTIALRQSLASGNDSGFNSMNRNSKQTPILGANSHLCSHSGTCVRKISLHCIDMQLNLYDLGPAIFLRGSKHIKSVGKSNLGTRKLEVLLLLRP